MRTSLAFTFISLNLFYIEIAPKCQFQFPFGRPQPHAELLQYTVKFLYRLDVTNVQVVKLPELLFYSATNTTGGLHTLESKIYQILL